MKISIGQLRALIKETLEEATIDIKDIFNDEDVYTGKERRQPYVKGVFPMDAPEIKGHFLSDDEELKDEYSGKERRASSYVLPIDDIEDF